MLTHKGTVKIETERFILRRFKMSDQEDMFNNWGSDPLVSQLLSWSIHESMADTERVLRMWVVAYSDPTTYNWVIENKISGQVIGSISVIRYNEVHLDCEIGYCISSFYWNQGIGTEALKAIIPFLFEDVGMNRICAMHDTQNGASGEVMKKAGMTYEGTLRDIKYRMNTGFYDLSVYSILKREYESTYKRV